MEFVGIETLTNTLNNEDLTMKKQALVILILLMVVLLVTLCGCDLLLPTDDGVTTTTGDIRLSIGN